MGNDLKGHVFPHRGVHMWKDLPKDVVESGRVSTFKMTFDRVHKWKDLWGYGISLDMHLGSKDEIGLLHNTMNQKSPV